MKIKISVRSFVEFLLREGDIDNRQVSGMQATAMRLGSRMHRKLQKAGPMYQAEVPLKMEFEEEHYTIVLEGRADGIIQTEGAGEVVIDEIKASFLISTRWKNQSNCIWHRRSAMRLSMRCNTSARKLGSV